MGTVLYGELAIIGFNGAYLSKRAGVKRRTKIAFYKRPVANGVSPGPVSYIRDAYNSVNSQGKHSVSYTLSKHETIVVEYVSDPKTDMFQIGRSTNNHIDFVVSEPQLSSRSRNRRNPAPTSNPPARTGPAAKKPPVNAPPSQEESAVSRFACRIHIERDPPYTARIYAAGFDETNEIVLGELAVKWKFDGRMDGFTTNGIMILRPEEDQCASASGNGIQLASGWREVSIGGSVYQMRAKRCVPSEENRVNEDNVLRDKTLIDLCGVTLFWRSADGLKSTLDESQLRAMINVFNEARFQCPVMYHTLRLVHPDQILSEATDNTATRNRNHKLAIGEARSEPYVYLNCGHVYGWHSWVADGDHPTSPNGPCVRTCAMCLQPSSFVPLLPGLEMAFYVDRGFATHCFNPCGHMASEKTVRFWCSIPLPDLHNFEFRPRCPFCLTPVEPKPVLLRFSGDVDAETLAESLQATLNLDTTPTLNEHLFSVR